MATAEPINVDTDSPERYLNCARAVDLLWAEIAAEGEYKVSVKIRPSSLSDTINMWTLTAHSANPNHDVMPLMHRLLTRGIIKDGDFARRDGRYVSLVSSTARTSASFSLPLYLENKMIPL